MNRKKLLPVLLTVLCLVWLLLGCQGEPGPAPAEAKATQTPAAELVLLAPSPSATQTPGASAKPAATPKTAKPKATQKPAQIEEPEELVILDEDGSYTTKDDVAFYIYIYGHLPSNFITKKEAQAAGWTGGSLDRVLPGMCIGGDYFGNYEGQLPKAKGRRWTECDINTLGARSRGSERIIFSNDGLIYYTSDHYESFELLYD
jgi:hypothetical protein